MATTAPQIYDIYVNLRPRNSEALKAYSALEDIVATYPGANAYLAGIGRDTNHTTFCIAFSVPVIEGDASSISALRCVHAIFTSMFDFVPCYTVEPTDAEKFAAEQFRAHRMSLKEDSYVIESDQEILV